MVLIVRSWELYIRLGFERQQGSRGLEIDARGAFKHVQGAIQEFLPSPDSVCK